jgi:hypothetical protein
VDLLAILRPSRCGFFDYVFRWGEEEFEISNFKFEITQKADAGL